VGESGSGKSTLVQSLYFDQPATAGKVLFKGIDEGQTNLLGLSNQRK
jgi:putative phosphonate transport system ATP-binding protein